LLGGTADVRVSGQEPRRDMAPGRTAPAGPAETLAPALTSPRGAYAAGGAAGVAGP
jgi:hypothetical protein